MNGQVLQTDSLSAGALVTQGSVTVLPIERATLHASLVDEHAWFAAAKEPVAVIVRDAQGVRAIGVDAQDVSLQGLFDTIAGLEALCNAMGRTQ